LLGVEYRKRHTFAGFVNESIFSLQESPESEFGIEDEILQAVFKEKAKILVAEPPTTLSMLQKCAAEVEKEKQTDDITKERIKNMLKFFETTSDWYEQIQEIPTPTLKKIMKLGRGITKLIR